MVEKPIDADYSVLTEEIETDPKACKFKVGDRVLCWQLILGSIMEKK